MQNNAITPFKVIQGHRFLGTNRKLIYDFLLVINSNLPHILHRFQDIAVDNRRKGCCCLYVGIPMPVPYQSMSDNLPYYPAVNTRT